MESKKEILEAMGGIPEEVYDAIVLSFYEEARERLKSIGQGIDSNDYEAVSQGAHAIKGSAGNLRLMKIQEIARSLEEDAKAKDSANFVKLLEQLTQLIP